MTPNERLIAEARAIGNWDTHVERDTLFYRLVVALEGDEAIIQLAKVQNSVPFEAWDNPRNIALAMGRVLAGA